MKNVLWLACLVVLCLSCKKEKKDPNLQNSNGSPQTDSVRGAMSVSRVFLLDNDSLIAPENRASAIFYKDKGISPDSMPPKTIYVGNVFLNNVRFRADSGSSYYTYFDTTLSSFSSPYHWHIQGANGYQGLNFTQVMDFPAYHSASSIADTLLIDQQQTLVIGNYTGTSVTIVIDSDTGYLGYIEKKLDYPNNSFSLVPQDYSDKGITEGHAHLTVIISNVSYQPIYGQSYSFATSIVFSKSIYLKNS